MLNVPCPYPRPGTFILTFDCEGKWGSADHLDGRARNLLTTANLVAINQQLLAVLDRLGLRATFAFVGAYTLGAEQFFDELSRNRPAFDDAWGRAVLAEIQAAGADGWFNGASVRAAQCAGHEIAGHGFTHRLLSAVTPRDLVEWELDRMSELEPFSGRPWTLVFPRNEVGNTDALSKRRVVAYRQGRTLLRTRSGRALALIGELLPVKSAAESTSWTQPLPIPAGHFFNWRHGAKRLIPPSLTLARWTSMIDHAARTGGIVHLWTHPHNFITGPSGLPVLNEVLDYAASHVRRGTLINQTQLGYFEARSERRQAAVASIGHARGSDGAATVCP